MESKSIVALTLAFLFMLTSCRPDENSYLLNSTDQLFVLFYAGEGHRVPPRTKITFNKFKHARELTLKIDGANIELGKAIEGVSLEYSEKTSAFVGEPYHLLIEIKTNGFIYLGYQTIHNNRSGLFEKQPDGFPLKWNTRS